jgi:hypothetical protein
MKNNRREFIKKTGLLGMGLAGAGIISHARHSEKPPCVAPKQVFNMSGYRAPGLGIVRVGIVGLGNRGTGTVRRLSSIDGVEIRALCDIEPDRVKKSADMIAHMPQHKPEGYTGSRDAWKRMCERKDLDLISINTPWDLHTEQCVFSMEHGKHAYVELPAATTIEECWQLVETSERTRKHCVQMSSSCHFGIQAVVLNMVREGLFGDIIHAEGAYIHDLLLGYNFTKHMYHDMWRLRENTGRHGNLYPQHGFVPIIQMFGINYGDKMEYLSSVSTDDFLMARTAQSLASEDNYWEQFTGRQYRGNLNTTIIRTARGRTIVLQHDVSSPRPDVRFHLISGTEGIFKARPGRIARSHNGWVSEEEFQSLVKKYTPEITKRFEELTRKAQQVDRRGHSYYSTTPTDWRLIDCLRNGLPMDMDVYEAAASSCITPLSIWSAANRSNSIDVPDFTNGAWKSNPMGMDIRLEGGGGSTGLI